MERTDIGPTHTKLVTQMCCNSRTISHFVLQRNFWCHLMSLDVTWCHSLKTAKNTCIGSHIEPLYNFYMILSYIRTSIVSYNDNVHMLVSFSMLYIQIHGHSDCTKIVRGQPWMKLPRIQIVTHQYSVIRQNQVKGFREAVAWRQRRRREPAGKIRGSIRGKRKWYQCFAMKHV